MCELRNRKKHHFDLQAMIGQISDKENIIKDHPNNGKILIWEAEFLRRKNVESEFDDWVYHGPFPEIRRIFGSVLISKRDEEKFLKHKYELLTWKREMKMTYLYEDVHDQLIFESPSLASDNLWKIDVEFHFSSLEDVRLLMDDMSGGFVGIISAAGERNQYMVMRYEKDSNRFCGYVPLIESKFVHCFRSLLIYIYCCSTFDIDIKDGLPLFASEEYFSLVESLKTQFKGKSFNFVLSELYEKSLERDRINRFELFVYDFRREVGDQDLAVENHN